MNAKGIGPARAGDRVWFHQLTEDAQEEPSKCSQGGMGIGRVVEADDGACYVDVDCEGGCIRLERTRIIGINRMDAAG
jgi:hypothetical protein